MILVPGICECMLEGLILWGCYTIKTGLYAGAGVIAEIGLQYGVKKNRYTLGEKLGNIEGYDLELLECVVVDMVEST